MNLLLVSSETKSREFLSVEEDLVSQGFQKKQQAVSPSLEARANGLCIQQSYLPMVLGKSCTP